MLTYRAGAKPSASHADATGATKRTASISTGAKIFIESSPGCGTTVRIKLNAPPLAWAGVWNRGKMSADGAPLPTH